jgi:hypothetical protein
LPAELLEVLPSTRPATLPAEPLPFCSDLAACILAMRRCWRALALRDIGLTVWVVVGEAAMPLLFVPEPGVMPGWSRLAGTMVPVVVGELVILPLSRPVAGWLPDPGLIVPVTVGDMLGVAGVPDCARTRLLLPTRASVRARCRRRRDEVMVRLLSGWGESSVWLLDFPQHRCRA